MKKSLTLLAAILTWALPGMAQDIKDMSFDELRTNCVKEILTGYDTNLKQIKVLDFKVLAWYREKDDRPLYLDCALCWAKVSTKSGIRWVLAEMARNPTFKDHPVNRSWGLYYVTDVQNRWLLFFDKPPKNDDVYSKMRWFNFVPERGYVRYDSKILEKNWEAALGEKPTVKFSPNPK